MRTPFFLEVMLRHWIISVENFNLWRWDHYVAPKHREPFSQPGSIIFSPTTLWRPKNLQGNSDFIIVYEEMFYLFKWKSMFSKLLFHFFIQKLHTDVTGVPWKIRFCHKVSTERPLIKSILMCMIYIYSSVPLLSYILHFPWF